MRLPATCRKIGITEQTIYRWKMKYGNLGVPELRRLKPFEEESMKSTEEGKLRSMTIRIPEGLRDWAMNVVGARVTGLDELERTGIDGRITFQGNTEGALLETVVLRVVPRKTKTSHVRDLRGYMEQEKAALGALVTMDEPTESILAEAAESGFYEHPVTGEQFPRVQVIRVIDLIAGEPVQVPR